MESFRLSLNQVNFDEGAFSDSDELHSFSNLVCYDSDFKEGFSDGFPVRSRRIEQYEVADSFHCSQVNHMARVMDESKIGIGPVQMAPGSKDFVSTKVGMDSDAEIRGTTSKGAADGVDIPDSFKAFTETVEALALQKSVIGKKNVVPASAAEVARVVAATRARLGRDHRRNSSDSLTDAATLTSRGSDADSMSSSNDVASYQSSNNLSVAASEVKAASDVPSAGFQVGSYSSERMDETPSSAGVVNNSSHMVHIDSPGIAGSTRSVASPQVGGRMTEDHDKSELGKFSDIREALSHSNNAFGIQKGSESSGVSSSAENKRGTTSTISSPRDLEGKTLIRISAKDISTATKKSPSSWFWSKPSGEVTPSKQVPPRKSPQADRNTESGDVLQDKGQLKKMNKNESSAAYVHDSSSDMKSRMNTDPNDGSSSFRATAERDSMSTGKISTAKLQSDNSSDRRNSLPKQTAEVIRTTSNSGNSSAVSPQNSNSRTRVESLGKDVVEFSNSQDSSLSVEQTETKLNPLQIRPASSTLSSQFQYMMDEGGAKGPYQQTVISTRTSSTNELSHTQSTNTMLSTNSDQDSRTVSRQGSLDSSYSGSRDDLRLRLDQILKQKVKLEGQVEVLEAESSMLLKERAELQSKVAALMQELQSREKSRVGLAGDRDALSADLETLRQNRARLEAVIIDAHKLLEDKDQELRTLENDLEMAKDTGEKHLDQMKNFQLEMKSRDATIADLKTKITELYVEFQTTNQNRILAENEVGSLQGELKSMAAAKEWYKEQLQSSQREKSELQAEVTRVKAEMIAQGTAIERLKAENQRTKRQLAESEQKSLNEKQTLARHLESIEADMMEREAAFSQMQKDHQNVTDARDEKAEAEIITALKEDLSKASSDLKRSLGQVTLLQQEQSELVKRLTLSQQSILERDKMIEALEKNTVDVESQLKQLQLELTTRSEDIGRLEHDRTVLQMELKTAKEEKEVFDSSLRSLKDDMGVVEKSFRLMKQDLLSRQNELERLKVETGKTMTVESGNVQGQVMNDLYEIPQGFEFSPIHSIVKSLTKYQSSETQTDGEPAGELNQEPRAVDVKPVDPHVVEQLERERRTMEKRLLELEQQLETAETDKQHLSKSLLSAEQDLVIVKERSVDLELRLQRSYEEKERVEQSLNQEMDKSDRRMQPEKENREESNLVLQNENTQLRSQFGDLQRESHKEIARQKTKVLKLGKQLEMALKEHREMNRSHEHLVLELNQRLTVLEESNARLEGELTSAHQRVALDNDEKTQQMNGELQRVTEELETVRNAKHVLELELNQVISRHTLEVEEHRTRSLQLEMELQNARSYIEERKAADEETANLALELEREKGRLAGFLRSHSTLKEHASFLEANLASKESSVVQMSSEVEEELKMRERQIQELTEQVRLLEESLAKEQRSVKDARKQLMTEKGSHVKVRRELEQLSATHSQVVVELEFLRKELLKVTSDDETMKNEHVEQKMRIEQLMAEIKSIRLDRDRMSRELEDKEARESTLQEQIQSLEWKLSQKVAEMEAAEEKAQMVDERRQAETNGLSESLLAATNELYTIRDELASTRHEKAELKARVTQLKQVLLSIIEQCTKASEAGNAITIQMIMNKEELEKLLEDSTTPSIKSKPLSFLQVTLSGLRGEISSLQKQVNEHTSVVQNSSQAWRQLEAQVEDLRQVCKSSAAQRAASDKLLKTSEELSQVPPLSDIQRALQLPSTGPLVLPGNMVSIVKTTASHTSTSSRIDIIDIEKT